MPPHALPNPVPVRVLQGLGGEYRDAARPLDFLGSGPVGGRADSGQGAAAADVRHAVPLAEDEPDSLARPGPAEDHDVHAADVLVLFLESFERPGPVLV